MQKSILFILCLTLFSACADKSTQHEHSPTSDTTSVADQHPPTHGVTSLGNPELDILNRQVLAIHDSAMARMSELSALQEKAHQQSVALKPTEIQRKKELTTLLDQLNTADEAMLQWMQQFDSQMKTKTDSAKRVYLQAERIKIDLVYQQILTSIQTARTQLQNPDSQPY